MSDWQSAFLAMSQELETMTTRLDKVAPPKKPMGVRGWAGTGITIFILLVTSTAAAQHWIDSAVTREEFDPVVKRVGHLESLQPAIQDQLTQMTAVSKTTSRIELTLTSMAVSLDKAQKRADVDRWCSRQLAEHLKTRSLTKKWPQYPTALEDCRLGDRPEK